MSSTSPAPAPAKRRRGPLTKLAFAMLTLFVFLVFIEGLFSTVHIAHTFISKAKSPVAERSHTQYDEDLGWAPIPNLKLADGYGPAVPIQINGQGFRANVEYDAKPADGKIRIIASGDSFTFGHSVGDDHTWPRYLQSLDERFEVVNVGLGGYGLDQIYLRHERDAAKLERRFHIFAFIMEDFDRAMGESFNGYGKPQLTIKDGQLVTLHQPVPRRGFVRAFLNQNGPLLNEARTISVGSQIWNKVSGGGGGARAGAADAGASNQAIFEQTLAKMWDAAVLHELRLPGLGRAHDRRPEGRRR